MWIARHVREEFHNLKQNFITKTLKYKAIKFKMVYVVILLTPHLHYPGLLTMDSNSGCRIRVSSCSQQVQLEFEIVHRTIMYKNK